MRARWAVAWVVMAGCGGSGVGGALDSGLDLAVDLAPVGGEDLTTARDLSVQDSAGLDLAVPDLNGDDLASIDLSLPDLTAAPDLTASPDLAPAPDLAVAPDLAAPDLSPPRCQSDEECRAAGAPAGACCDGVCVDLDGDPAHCGDCAHPCPEITGGTAGCAAGACVVASCEPGRCPAEPPVPFADRCPERSPTDALNCGACGHACVAPTSGVAACVDGACAGLCGGGRTVCGATTDGGGACVRLADDPAHCGGCGHACAAPTGGTNGCTGSACAGTCSDGLTLCGAGPDGGGRCADLASDGAHCGACGHACVEPEGGSVSCVGSACVGSCPAGRTLCGAGPDGGGRCVDLGSDAAHCGACGHECASGRCGTALDASFASAPADWRLNGSASFDPDAASAVLTLAGVPDQAGTVLYQNPLLVDGTFEAAFDFRLSGSERADGIGFMLQRTGATAVGDEGGGFGMVGLDGYGVELDLFDNHNCSDAGGNGNHAGVDLLTTCDPSSMTPTPLYESGDLYWTVGDIGDGVWRRARVRLESGQVSLTIDDQPIFSGVALPGFSSGEAWYLGFGGGTGGSTARQEIRNVELRFSSPRCL